MEPITLCGLIIVLFGLWVEFEPAIMRMVTAIRRSRLYAALTAQPVRPPVYGKRLPLGAARTSL